MTPLALGRISTWFALFFIPMIPLSFKHATVCPNCKRLDYVPKAQVDAAHEARSQGRGQPDTGTTLETAVNQWATTAAPAQVGSPMSPNPHATSATISPRAPHGWYRDEAAGVERYWNGRQWTAITKPIE
jgi:Protein of unknown function (DUF2510)